MKENSKSSVNRARSNASASKNLPDFEYPMLLTGESESIDAEGAVVRRSRRYSLARNRAALQSATFLRSLERYLEIRDIKPMPRVKAPKRTAADIAVAYVMGDPHVGMYSWATETGADFDLKIAERDLCSAVEDLAERSPPSDKVLLANLGDYFHADNMQNRTEKSGNPLDVDTRWPQVLAVGLKIQEHMVNVLLKKHKHVHVINEIGNHDIQSSHMIMLHMDAVFRNNPRVTIDRSPRKCHFWRFGQSLIGTTHGDTIKMERCPETMAYLEKKNWGETRYHYWYTGHVHHSHVIERGDATVESFRTLAPKDAWAAGMGFVAGRDMQAIVLHKEYGEIERRRADIALVEAYAAQKKRLK